MLIGVDYERQLRLSEVHKKPGKKFIAARKAEADSSQALSVVELSPVAAPFEVMERSERALILQGAMSAALHLTSELINAGFELASTQDKKGDTLHYQGLFLGDAPSQNPSFIEYPNFVQRAFDKASKLAFGAVLIEIEEGDDGLVKLCLLPQESMRLIQPITTPTLAEPLHLFNTQIPGVSVGFSYPNLLSQQTYFIMHQLHSELALRGGMKFPT